MTTLRGRVDLGGEAEAPATRFNRVPVRAARLLRVYDGKGGLVDVPSGSNGVLLHGVRISRGEIRLCVEWDLEQGKLAGWYDKVDLEDERTVAA